LTLKLRNAINKGRRTGDADLWEMGEGLVKDVREKFDDPKPARNTVSTVIRILEKKGFIGHKD